MSTEANATDQPTPSVLSGAYIVAIVSGAWQQLVATLFEPSTRRVVNVTTSSYTITAEESGTTFHNKDAVGTVRLDLPAATVGLHYKALVRAAQIFALNPQNTEFIANATVGGSDGTAGYQIAVTASSGNYGAFIHLVCITAGRWEVESVRGTWTLGV